MKLSLILVSIFCCLYSCKNSTTPLNKLTGPASFYKSVYPADTFWLNIKSVYDTILHLPPMDKGVESFELRFWTDPQLIAGDVLFDVKYENGKWLWRKYLFVSEPDIDSKRFFSRHGISANALKFASHDFQVENPTEKLKTLFEKFDLKNLPTQASLPGYSGCCDDGVVYYLEFATKNSYKFLVYENPECCKNKDKMSNKFLEIKQDFESILPEIEVQWPLANDK